MQPAICMGVCLPTALILIPTWVPQALDSRRLIWSRTMKGPLLGARSQLCTLCRVCSATGRHRPGTVSAAPCQRASFLVLPACGPPHTTFTLNKEKTFQSLGQICQKGVFRLWRQFPRPVLHPLLITRRPGQPLLGEVSKRPPGKVPHPVPGFSDQANDPSISFWGLCSKG